MFHFQTVYYAPKAPSVQALSSDSVST